MSARLLHRRVDIAAEHRPEARAVVHPDGSLTYGDLDDLSDRLGATLREAGCEPGDRVGFLLPKTPLAIATIIGILKADCVYVPLDSRSPGRRLEKIVRQCEPRVLLASPATAGRLFELAACGALEKGPLLGWMAPGDPEAVLGEPQSGSGSDPDGHEDPEGGRDASLKGQAVPTPPKPAFTLRDVLDRPPGAPPSATREDDPAYIMFTSGSTGDPKGVVISHGNVTAYVDWAVEEFGLGEEDRLAGHAPLTFDLSTFDVHATFACRGELHLVPSNLNLLPHRMVDFIRESRLTHWHSVPSLLDYIARFDALDGESLPDLQRVTWCGDVFPTPSLLYWKRLLPEASFVNLYGPTETTVASGYYRVPDSFEDPGTSIPIGWGCGGDELLVLDEDLQEVPPGTVGDLYIRGPGLSSGYWRDPERTAKAFIPDPSEEDPEARIYRTGDLARVDDRGQVHFLGREDQQIKTRGYRVELGEVEKALLTLPEIEACAVVPVITGGFEGKVIGCAFTAANGSSVRPSDLKARVAELVPDYMIPIRWTRLESLPLNARGKVDRRRIRQALEGGGTAAHESSGAEDRNELGRDEPWRRSQERATNPPR